MPKEKEGSLELAPDWEELRLEESSSDERGFSSEEEESDSEDDELFHSALPSASATLNPVLHASRSTNPLSLPQKAKKALAWENYQEALKLANQMLSDDDTLVEAYCIKAHALYHLHISLDEIILLCRYVLAGNTEHIVQEASYIYIAAKSLFTAKEVTDKVGNDIRNLLENALERKKHINTFLMEIEKQTHHETLLAYCDKILALDHNNEEILWRKLSLLAKRETAYFPNSPPEQIIDTLLQYYPLSEPYRYIKNCFTLLRQGFDYLNAQTPLLALENFVAILNVFGDLQPAWQGLFSVYLSNEVDFDFVMLSQIRKAMAIFKHDEFSIPYQGNPLTLSQLWKKLCQDHIIRSVVFKIMTIPEKTAHTFTEKEQKTIALLHEQFNSNPYWKSTVFFEAGEQSVQQLKAVLLKALEENAFSLFPKFGFFASAKTLPDTINEMITTVLKTQAQLHQNTLNQRIIPAAPESQKQEIDFVLIPRTDETSSDTRNEQLKMAFKDEAFQAAMKEYYIALDLQERKKPGLPLLRKPKEAVPIPSPTSFDQFKEGNIDTDALALVAHPTVSPIVGLAATVGTAFTEWITNERRRRGYEIFLQLCPNRVEFEEALSDFIKHFANAYETQFTQFQPDGKQLKSFAVFVGRTLADYFKTNLGKHNNLSKEIFYKLWDNAVANNVMPLAKDELLKTFLMALAYHPRTLQSTAPFEIMLDSKTKKNWSLSGLLCFPAISHEGRLYGNNETQQECYGSRKCIAQEELTIYGMYELKPAGSRFLRSFW